MLLGPLKLISFSSKAYLYWDHCSSLASEMRARAMQCVPSIAEAAAAAATDHSGKFVPKFVCQVSGFQVDSLLP